MRLIISGAAEDRWGYLEPATSAESAALERCAAQGEWSIGRGDDTIRRLRVMAERLGYPATEVHEPAPVRQIVVQCRQPALIALLVLELRRMVGSSHRDWARAHASKTSEETLNVSRLRAEIWHCPANADVNEDWRQAPAVGDLFNDDRQIIRCRTTSRRAPWPHVSRKGLQQGCHGGLVDRAHRFERAPLASLPPKHWDIVRMVEHRSPLLVPYGQVTPEKSFLTSPLPTSWGRIL
jgi:hypothetical protein